MQTTCPKCGAANAAPESGATAQCTQCGTPLTDAAPQAGASGEFFSGVVEDAEEFRRRATGKHDEIDEPDPEMEEILGEFQQIQPQGPEPTPLARPGRVSRTSPSLPTLEKAQSGALAALPPEITDKSVPPDSLVDTLLRRWRQSDIKIRGLIVGGAIILMVIPLLIGLSLGGSELPFAAWVIDTHPLLSLPDRESETEIGGPLTRGSETMVLEYLGEFALIRDRRGRAGFVLTEALSRTRPELNADDFSFPDCHPRYDEGDLTGCLTFAEQMHAECVELCPDAVKKLCSQGCDGRYDECKTSCERPLQTPKQECPACECPEPAAEGLEDKPRTRRRGKKKRRNR